MPAFTFIPALLWALFCLCLSLWLATFSLVAQRTLAHDAGMLFLPVSALLLLLSPLTVKLFSTGSPRPALGAAWPARCWLHYGFLFVGDMLPWLPLGHLRSLCDPCFGLAYTMRARTGW